MPHTPAAASVVALLVVLPRTVVEVHPSSYHQASAMKYDSVAEALAQEVVQAASLDAAVAADAADAVVCDEVVPEVVIAFAWVGGANIVIRQRPARGQAASLGLLGDTAPRPGAGGAVVGHWLDSVHTLRDAGQRRLAVVQDGYFANNRVALLPLAAASSFSFVERAPRQTQTYCLDQSLASKLRQTR